LVTGASDDDPSGIATYSQAGAQFRFSLLWSALVTLPLMTVILEICDRTSLATGKGLGTLIAQRLPRWTRPVTIALLVSLIAANTLNISADLVAIGSGMHLLHAGPQLIWAIVAGVAVVALLATNSFHIIGRVFKVLALALVAYVVVVVLIHPSWGRVLSATFIPHFEFNRSYIAMLVAVLGTTISPYLFFWQSQHRIEERREEGTKRGARPLKRRSDASAIRKERGARIDVFSGVVLSNLVMWAIMLSTAQTLGMHGRRNIQSAAEAASALAPLAGRYASVLFALGFVGSGLLAVPVLAGSGAAGLAGLLGDDWGFSKSIRSATVFYALVGVATVGGMVLSIAHVNPIRLLVLVATINGVAAAPFLALVMIISGDGKIMGKLRNGVFASVVGWGTTALMALAAIALLVTGGS
jgi:NRAMP (natural resistance-associated macrophage protein)-like metal ion transporter